MKKFLVAAFLAMLFVSLAALMTMPSGGNAAASQYGPKDQAAGQYLYLFNHPSTYAANTAFHLNEGWPVVGKRSLPRTYEVRFEVDGIPRPADFFYTETTSNPVTKRWVLNFPSGLSGPHDLTIQWWAPCSAGPGPCANPKQVVQHRTITETVNFS
jgi:hypothetical protein